MAREGRVAMNAWVSMGSSYLTEILGHTGFDAVTIELQHGAYGFDTAVQLLHAVSSTPAIPLARSAGATLAEINKLLDDHVLSLAMIETMPALDAVERILDVDELDGIYVGPSDLGLAMGIGPDAWPAKEMVDAVAHVLAAARRRGKYAGIFASSVEMSQAVSAMGYHMVTPGNDAQLLRSAAAVRIDGPDVHIVSEGERPIDLVRAGAAAIWATGRAIYGF